MGRGGGGYIFIHILVAQVGCMSGVMVTLVPGVDILCGVIVPANVSLNSSL